MVSKLSAARFSERVAPLWRKNCRGLGSVRSDSSPRQPSSIRPKTSRVLPLPGDRAGGQQILIFRQTTNRKANDVNHTEPEFFLQRGD